MFERFAFDLKQAIRGLWGRPVYTAACVGTLALVVGVNAALFAAINATLFRPIGLTSGERTVTIYTMPAGLSDPKYRNPLHAIDLVRFRERSRTLTHISGMSPQDRVLGSGDDPLVVRTAAVSAELLRLAPEAPALGRTFDEAEETRKERLIVLSHGFWRRQFGADPSVVGRVVSLDGEPYAIAGVMPQSFPPQFLEADLWTPLGITTSAPADETRTYIVPVAELATGATLSQADEEIRRLIGDLSRELPRSHRGFSGGVIGFREWQYGNFKAPLTILFVAVTALMLIAASNVASLTLANVTARQGEIALRRAIGATRVAVARLVLTEIVIVNLIGAACAMALGAWLLPALLRIAPSTTAVLGNVAMDWRVGLYAFGCAALSSLAAGVVPAISAADSATASSAGARSTTTKERRRWRAVLLAAQTALSVALLVSGGLLVRAFVRSSAAAPGFDPTRTLTAQLRLPPARYGNAPDRMAVLERILDGFSRIPGVTAAASTQNQFKPGFTYQTAVEIENRPTPTGAPHTVQWRRVSPEYFRAMRIREIEGRTFTRQDSLDTLPVAVVSASFARRYWEDDDPVGRRIRRGDKWLTIVGVVSDVSDVDLLQPPEPTLYAPWAQTSNTNFPIGLVVRTAGNPIDVASAVRAVVASADPTLALDRIQPLETFLADSIAPQRFRATLMVGLAAAGLLLGAIGVAGVTARSIVERMPEFGIRLALGCESTALWGGAVAEPLRIVAVGAVCGVGLALAAGRGLGAVLPETGGIDPTVVLGALGCLAATVVAAAAIPASRVLRVDPVAVLRSSI